MGRTGSCNRPKALLDEALSDLITWADPMFFSSWKYRFPLALIGLGCDMASLRSTPRICRTLHFPCEVSHHSFSLKYSRAKVSCKIITLYISCLEVRREVELNTNMRVYESTSVNQK